MVCALIDDWVYMDMGNGAGIYGRQEIDRNLKSKIKNLRVAFLDYQSKIVTLPEGEKHRDALVNSTFKEDYLIAHERLTENSIVVMGSQKETIAEIYRYFDGISIENLVPYGVAVRAFLRAKGLLDSSKSIVFLDDLRNQTVLTFFEGNYFSSSRRISMRDPSYMIAEVKRSWQSFLLERPNQRNYSKDDFTVVSNNSEWLDHFVEKEFLVKKDIVHINNSFIALEGLRNAKFSIHFSPLEQIIKQRKQRKRIDYLRAIIINSLIILSGTLLSLATYTIKQKELKQEEGIRKRIDSLIVQLKDTYPNKFLDLLDKDEPINYAKVYYDFIKSIPEGYLVDNIKMEKKGDNWDFQGDILPANNSVLQKDFKKDYIFSKAEVSWIVLNNFLGQEVRLRIGPTESL